MKNIPSISISLIPKIAQGIHPQTSKLVARSRPIVPYGSY